MTWTPYLIEQMKKLRARGKSAQEIAEAVGKSRNAVLGQCFRLGLKTGDKPRAESAARKPKSPPPPQDRRAAQLAEDERRARADQARKRQEQGSIPPQPISQQAFICDEALPTLEWPEANTCRWSYGDKPPFRWCANTAAPGASYCEAHRARAIERVLKKSESVSISSRTGTSANMRILDAAE